MLHLAMWIWTAIVVATVVVVQVVAGCRRGAVAQTATSAKTPATKSKSIEQCLADPRADMAVSLWLQEKVLGPDNLAVPHEVLVACRADRILSEVNSGGFLGFFDWEREAVPATLESLSEMGLDELAGQLKKAMDMPPKHWPISEEELDAAKEKLLDDDKRSAAMDALDQAAIADSAHIEKATHEYIRAHLGVFLTLD